MWKREIKERRKKEERERGESIERWGSIFSRFFMSYLNNIETVKFLTQSNHHEYPHFPKESSFTTPIMPTYKSVISPVETHKLVSNASGTDKK